MKLLSKVLTGTLLFLLGIFVFESCDRNIVDVEEQKTTVTFSMENKDVNYYGKYWWNMNSGTEPMKISPLKPSENGLSKIGAAYDEIRILCLDMTKWKDMEEFITAWESTEQYSLFDTTFWTSGRDYWDNTLLMLKSYTGDYYQYVGEVNLKIDNSVARGSISLNPGLNYFCYALRKDGKTIYDGETHAKIQENGENAVSITIQQNINYAPALPYSPDPYNGAVKVPLDTQLSWQCYDPEGDAITYDIYFDTLSNFQYPVLKNSSTTYYSPAPLMPNTTYYWKIVAYDVNYNSATGQVWSFTTTSGNTATLGAPVLLSPANGATYQSITPTLIWNVVTGATSYTLQVSADTSFSNPVYNKNGLIPTTFGASQQVTGLSNSTTYYWRVSSANSYGSSDWSDVWSFTTISGSNNSFCPGTPTVTYAGKTYNTVQIGSQCWLKENLDVGTMVNGGTEQTNNGTIEKYCYNDDLVNCTMYGGLYQWDEAMGYSTTPGKKGICPAGWHIPTDTEYQILMVSINNDGNVLKAVGQGDANYGGAGTNTTGFSALLAGYRYYGGYFHDLADYTYYWSSTEYDAATAYSLSLYGLNSSINQNNYYRSYGYSVRCLAD
ncbi:MAG: FISUMP domain-containing protein [Ignavibacteria bacterium]